MSRIVASIVVIFKFVFFAETTGYARLTIDAMQTLVISNAEITLIRRVTAAFLLPENFDYSIIFVLTLFDLSKIMRVQKHDQNVKHGVHK